MAVESRPCGDGGGEATVRCCESMAVDSFFFFSLFLFYRFFAVLSGYVSPSLSIHYGFESYLIKKNLVFLKIFNLIGSLNSGIKQVLVRLRVNF